MQASELRELTVEELRQQLRETRREMFNLRQQWYAGSLQDSNRLRVLRKDTARVLTVLREREIASQMGKGDAA